MSRRAKKEDLDTGSDSFLDIIANIVGILIILIVIAGVRVSQLPGDAAQEPPVVEQLPEPESTEDEIEAEPVLIVEAELGHAEELPSEELLPREIVAPIVEVVKEPEPEPPRPPQPSPQLLAEITLLEQNNRNLRADAAGLKPQLEKTVRSKRETEEKLSATQQKMEQHLNQMTFVEAQLHERKQEMKDDMTHLALLADELEARKTPPSNIKNLTHKLTPVSEVVEGDEFHFRLENNRVSYIPLNQLIDQLKSNILRRKAWLAKSRSHHGSVGPIEGYRMRYLVERQPLSVVEELQNGAGMFRVGVSAWQIQLTSEIQAETAAEALQVGSRFVNALKNAPANTTLTFWVYPDSFGLFRQLQEVAHANGFIVAARPLPDGVPIAGSPSGSRSAGQ